MSIDINWATATSGADGEALAERIRCFVHDKFQQIALPRFIRSVQVHSFDFGTVAPELEIKDFCEPFADFYEEDCDEDDDEGEVGEEEDEEGRGDRPGRGRGRERSAFRTSSTVNNSSVSGGGDSYFPQSTTTSIPTTPTTTTLRSPMTIPGRVGGGGGGGVRAGDPHPHPPHHHSHPHNSSHNNFLPRTRTGTPGILGGTSHLGYHLMSLGGLSGTQTPLAAVAGGSPFAATASGFSAAEGGLGSPVVGLQGSGQSQGQSPGQGQGQSSGLGQSLGQGYGYGYGYGQSPGLGLGQSQNPGLGQGFGFGQQQQNYQRRRNGTEFGLDGEFGSPSRPSSSSAAAAAAAAVDDAQTLLEVGGGVGGGGREVYDDHEQREGERGQRQRFNPSTSTPPPHPHPHPHPLQTNPPRIRMREPKPEDFQVLCHVKYSGDIRLCLTAEILLDYPMPSFVGLPLKLNVTGVTFDGVAIVAYIRRHVHFCFLAAEDAAALFGDDHGGGDGGGGDRERSGGLLKEIRVDSEIGRKEDGKQVLKNVGKVERFVLAQVRRIFEEELVFPSFWTFLI